MTLRKLLILCTLLWSGSANANFTHFECEYLIPNGNTTSVGTNWISLDTDIGIARVDGKKFSGGQVEIGDNNVQIKEQKTKILATQRTYQISRLDLSYQNKFLD